MQEHCDYVEDVYTLHSIHQTVREYLLESGLQELQDSTVGGPLAGPHYQIFRTSVKFLFMKEALTESLVGEQDLGHLFRYSLMCLGYHFYRTDPKEVDPEELLDLFQWPLKSQIPSDRVQHISKIIENDPFHEYVRVSFPIHEDSECLFDWPCNSGSTVLHFAAFVGNTSILESAIRRDNGYNLHAEDDMEWTPLSIAVGQAHEEFAVRILSHNQDFEIKAIDFYDEHNGLTTITHEAARCGLNRVLEKLLEVGVDVDGLEELWPSPLCFGLSPRDIWRRAEYS